MKGVSDGLVPETLAASEFDGNASTQSIDPLFLFGARGGSDSLVFYFVSFGADTSVSAIVLIQAHDTALYAHVYMTGPVLCLLKNEWMLLPRTLVLNTTVLRRADFAPPQYISPSMGSK
jgi:hypothetical protein